MKAFQRIILAMALLLGAFMPVLGQCTLSVTISASNNGVICSGNSVVLTASVTAGTAPYSYLWTTGENTASINVNKAGTYTVTVSDNTPGCQPVKQIITIIATNAPDAPTAAGVTVCKGNPATLTATAPAGAIYQWYDAGGTFLAGGDNYVTPAINTATVFYVEATIGGCTGPRTPVAVNIYADPVVTNASICAGNPATLSATGGDSFNWYDAPGGNMVGSGATFVTPVLSANTTYYVVATNNGCAGKPIAATVTVTPAPQKPIPTATNITICNGTSANLHADVSDGGTIAWFTTATGGIPLISSPDYSTPNLTATTIYYVQNSSAVCESQRVAVTITVTPVPDAPTVAPPNATTCFGTSTVLTASTASGGTFIWYADAAGTSVLSTTNPFTTPALTANTTFYVQTVNGGCYSSLTPVTVTVTDNPPAPTVAPVAQVCPGTTATISATSPGGTYSWYDAATGGNLLFTGDTFTPVVNANTTYYVQTTNTNGCISARTAVPVTVLPAATPPTVNPVTVCFNNPATLTASGSDNYLWYDAATGGNLLTSGDTFTTSPLATNATYYVETVINGCTSARTAVTVTVTPIPQQPTVSGTTTICPGTTTPLSASISDGGTIKWYNVATGGTVLATGNNYSPTVGSTTTYYAENNLGTCVSARVGVTVTTTPVNFPLFQYPSATICNSAGTVTPIVPAPGGTFSASPATLIINSTTGVINATLSPLGKYTVTFKSNNSCQTISQVTISIVLSPDATFSYNGAPYCEFGITNPSPSFTAPASAGKFTASPAGLVFVDPNTGVIDLQKSTPGTYDITNTIVVSGICPQSVFTQTGIVINPGVTINAGPDQTIKSGSTAQLAGSVTSPSGAVGVKWTGGTGTFSNSTITNPVYTPGAGETTATLTLTTTTGTTCGVTSDQVKITIAPKPANPTVAPPPANCSGSSVILKATAPGGTYEWFTVATSGTKIFTGNPFTTPVLTAGTTYYVQTTIAGNTSDRTQVNVTINPLPAAPTAPAVSTCFNSAAILTATGSPGTYEWYATATGGTALATGSTYTTPVLTGNASYYVQAVDNGCVSLQRTKVDVTITQPPAVTSAATGVVCSGSVLNYTITTNIAATYSWDRPAVMGISNPAVSGNTTGAINETLINTGSTAVKVTYNITSTTNGCSSLFKYVVTVNPLGSATSATKSTVCSGEPVNYTFTFSDPGITFKWSRAAVAGISNLAVSDQAAPIIKESLYNTSNVPIDVTYAFTYLEGNCAGTFTYTATIYPAVTVNSAVYSDGCSGMPNNYTITSNVPGATFKWSREAFPNISNPPVSNQTSSTITEALINTSNAIVYVPYYITPYANGCQGQQFVYVVGVYPIPSIPAVNSNSPVCIGNTIYLQTPTVANASYLWTGPNGFSSTLQNPQINNVSAAGAGTYRLSTIINNCASPAATIDVKVNIPPVVTAGPAQVVCVTQNAINITGTVSGGTTTGIWSTSGTGTFSPSAGQLNTQYIPSAQDKTNGSVVLSLTSTSKDDCTPAIANTTITFGATPAVDAGPDQEACAQSKGIPLNGKLLKPGSATWSTSGTGSFTPSANQLNASYVPSTADISGGSVKLTLTYTNAGLCDIATDETIIKLIPPPKVYAGGTRYVLKDHTITLQPTVGDENVQYLWTPNVGINDNTLKNPLIMGGDTDIVYTLTITDSRGCTSQDKALIKVSPLITVSNTFTPNGDGVNDVWTITGLLAYVNATVDIFNRYGKTLYHSIGYNKAWDGTYDGQPLPTGTYYYVIRLNSGDGQILSGALTIIK